MTSLYPIGILDPVSLYDWLSLALAIGGVILVIGGLIAGIMHLLRL